MKRIIAMVLCCLFLSACASDPAGGPSTAASIPTETLQAPSVNDPQPTATTLSEPAPPVSPTETVPTEAQPVETEPSETDPAGTEPALPTQPSDPLDAYMKTLTLEQLVGQLFLARCPSSGAIRDVENYHLGGYILFAPDFQDETPNSITATIADYQSAADIPLLIAVDEEGGKVNRVSKFPAFRETPFQSPRKLFDKGGLDLIRSTEVEKAQLLHSLGINVNLAPVCDITTDPDAFMYSRSLGQDAATTADFIRTVLEINEASGMSNVLKHFPGYGNNTDTHVAIAIDHRSLEELEGRDLIPFQAGIDAGCGAIMVSHTFINAIDPMLPATLSPTVHDYLRNKMGFDGVIVTDDLVMQAITDLYGAGESAIMAVLAGNDLLISTDYEVQYPAVLNAVKDGTIPESIVHAAARRVLQWKIDMGMLQI